MSLGVAALLAVPAALSAQDASRIRIQTVPVADNLYMLAGGGGNVAALVGDEGVLLVDDGIGQVLDKITAAVGQITDKPIRLVINTHWHFDHVGGNEGLARSGALIVAHENVRKRMSTEQHLAGLDRRVPPSPPAALPVIVFQDALTIYWGDEEVRVVYSGTGHTDGDSIVHFRKANVLHVGDIWFNGVYPFIDINAGGSIQGMVAAQDRALALADGNTKIIPGHGPMSDARELREFRDMLASVRDRVQKLLAEGKTRAEIIAAKPTSEFDSRYGVPGRGLDPDTWVGIVVDGMEKKRTE
jgi:cyclase